MSVRGASVVALVLLAAAAEGLKLPPYLKQCSKTDKNINDCFIKNANDGIEGILHGDKTLKIPNLLPLNIDEVKISPSSNFELIMKKIKVYGLDGAKVSHAKVNLETLKIQLTVDIPKVELLGDYEVHGRVLVLPIEGTGPANITLIDGQYVYNVELELFDKKGEEYARIKNHNINLKSKRTYYRLDNLFNGNKELSDQMNTFLNENSREVSRDIAPAVGETISVVVSSIIAAVLKVVPWNNVVLP